MFLFRKARFSNPLTYLFWRRSFSWTVCINWWKYTKNIWRSNSTWTRLNNLTKIWFQLIKISIKSFWTTLMSFLCLSFKKWSRRTKRSSNFWPTLSAIINTTMKGKYRNMRKNLIHWKVSSWSLESSSNLVGSMDKFPIFMLIMVSETFLKPTAE